MEEEPQHTTEPPEPPQEAPPPFDPDPALIQHLERGGKPSEAEVRAAAERTKK
jgi:hypothetical protein